VAEKIDAGALQFGQMLLLKNVLVFTKNRAEMHRKQKNHKQALQALVSVS